MSIFEVRRQYIQYIFGGSATQYRPRVVVESKKWQSLTDGTVDVQSRHGTVDNARRPGTSTCLIRSESKHSSPWTGSASSCELVLSRSRQCIGLTHLLDRLLVPLPSRFSTLSDPEPKTPRPEPSPHRIPPHPASPLPHHPILTQKLLPGPPRLRLPTYPPYRVLVNFDSQPRALQCIDEPPFLNVKSPLALPRQIAHDIHLPRLHIIVNPQRHLLNHKVRRTQRDLHARRQRDRANGTVRRDAHVVRFCHRRDFPHLADPARMRQIRLEDIDDAVFEAALGVPAGVEALAERDGRGGELGQLLQRLRVLHQQRLLDEQRTMWFEGSGQLIRHGPVQTAVEVEGGVHAEGLDGLEALDAGVERGRRVEPVDGRGGVHLHAFQALPLAGLGGGGDVVGAVAADPAVDFDFVADTAAEESVDGDREFLC